MSKKLFLLLITHYSSLITLLLYPNLVARRDLRKFKRAVTDSGTEIRFNDEQPAINNLLTIYQLLTKQQPAEIEAHFAGKGYAQLKGDLADVMIEFLRPLQERVREISDEELNRILNDGKERARAIARATLDEAKARVGLTGAR